MQSPSYTALAVKYLNTEIKTIMIGIIIKMTYLVFLITKFSIVNEDILKIFIYIS